MSITELPPTFREWIAEHAPDVPRARSLPWMGIAIAGAVLLAVAVSLIQNGLRAFLRADSLVPLLVLGSLFGVPLGVITRREWRRNQVGKKNGRALGFHFAPGATLWHGCVAKVWIIPQGCVRAIHLAAKYVPRFGIFADEIIIHDGADGEVVVPADFDLPALWHALRIRHPGARASYAPELADQMENSAPPAPAQGAEIAVLAAAPDLPPPPPAPAVSKDVDWLAIHVYLRALFAGQGIAVQWGNEQPTGVTPVGISAPLRVQWQTLAPLAPALCGSVGIALAAALAAGRGTEWVSLRRIEFNDWVECDVNWWNPAAAT